MPPTLRVKLTKRSVDAAQASPDGEIKVWDTDLKGFVLRVQKGGRKVYAVRYRLGSRQCTFTIGTHGSPWTPDTAREAAVQALARVAAGEDPATEKRAARAALTVSQLIDTYLADGPATKPAKRESSWREDTSNLRRHIAPQLGRKLADGVSKADAAKAIQAITTGATATDEKTRPRGRARVTGGSAVARRTRTVAAAMYAWAIEHGLAKTNPFAGVRLAAALVRERFLSRQEAGRFVEALAQLEAEGEVSEVFGAALRLLLLTGARKTEILGLRWSEIDAEHGRLNLPPERTKAGGKTGERRIMLSPPALAVIDSRRVVAQAATTRAERMAAQAGEAAPERNPYVFPAARGHGHANGLRTAFLKVTARAELDGLRIHDMRHSFASFAVANGASLFIVSKLLGHADSRTTERYAHLSADPLAEAAGQVAQSIMPSAPTAHRGKVVPFRRPPSKRP